MRRRTFVHLLSGSIMSVVLSGCGGSNSMPRKTIRGIVLEDDGSRNVKPAGAGKRIAAIYAITDSLLIDTIVTTDAQGRFKMDLTLGRSYALKTDSYPGSLNFIATPIDSPSCATTVGIDSVTETSVRIYYGIDSLSSEWTDRAQQYLDQYKADGEDIDVVILADLPCVAHQ